MYLTRDLHLCPSLEKAQADDAFFAVVQAVDGLAQGDVGEPVVVGVARVADLVHHADRVCAVMEHRLEQRHRVEDGVEREHDFLLGDVHRPRQLHDVRLALVLAHEGFLGLQGAVRRVAQTAGNAKCTVVAQIAADFPNDHRHERSKVKKTYPACDALRSALSIV